MSRHFGMPHQEFRVVETEELDDANTDGTVTVQDGQRESVVNWRTHADRIKLYGLGVNDEQDCTYQIFVDGELSSETESPLGTMQNPFRFPEMFGQPVSATEEVDVKVINNSGGSKDFVARLFLRELNLPDGHRERVRERQQRQFSGGRQ